MKHMKQTALRKTVLVLVAVALVVCMSVAFVACNNGNDAKSLLDSIDSATFNQTLNGMIGYMHEHGEEYYYTSLSGSYSADEEDSIANEVLNLSLYMSGTNYNSSNSCYVLFYKSEQDATDNLEDVEEAGNQSIITKNKSVIIVESKEGLYDSIKASQLPTDDTSKAKLNFFNDAIKKTWTTNAGAAAIHCNGLDELNVYSIPKKGNIPTSYQCYTKNANTEGIEEKFEATRNQYTSSSYVKETDGVYYIYAQAKAGFVFEESEDGDGYVIEEYYYTDAPATLVIPATYNNKPVVAIEYVDIPEETTAITIPASVTSLSSYIFEDREKLTTINFKGTKAQWEDLDVRSYYLEYVKVIHCSDGDITLNQEA